MEQEDVRRARCDLAAAYNLTDKLGLNEGICNHLTVLVPGKPLRFLVIAYGMGWDEVSPKSLLLCDEDGTVLEGEGEVEKTAFEIHRAIHLADPVRNVACFHTHMPYATALCCIAGGRLRMCHQNSCRFYEEVSYDPVFNGLVEDSNEGERVAAAMGGRRVLMHAAHGAMICGASVAEAFDDMYYLERAAQVQVLAQSALAAGEKLVEVDEDVARRTKQRFDELKAVEAKKHFRARVRSLDPLAGVYADNRYPSEIATTDTSVKCKLKVTS